MMRLDRFLGENGYGTRAETKKLIKSGRVKVNEVIVKQPDSKILENEDIVKIDGTIIEYEKFHYLMLNKPMGYVCSAKEKGQQSVLTLINETFANDLFPIGRLDKDTEGLLILTNDGQLSHRLLSPSKHVDKVYEVKLRDKVSKDTEEAFAKGIDIGDEKLTLPAKLSVNDTLTEAVITIHEGRFHQIKRMFEACGNEVISLKRIKMKNVELDDALAPSEYRRLSEEEIRGLNENE